jgi:hypothetical protein
VKTGKLHSKLNGGIMLASKKMTLSPILESNGGVHLSVYLVNRSNLIDLKAQIREIISQSYEHLSLTMSLKETSKFLEPLDSLLLDANIFKKMKGNIGIFRKQDFFVVINLPIEVEKSFQVATSFHVKPLLKWLQNDHDFLLLGLGKDSAELYLGGQDSFKLIDSVILPEFFKNRDSLRSYLSTKEIKQLKIKEEETFIWLNEWVTQITKVSSPKLFIAGERSIVESMKINFKYDNLVKAAVANSFGAHNVLDVCQSIRKILKTQSKNCIERALSEFLFAEEENRSCKNIFQITKAVVEGRVRKLIISDDVNVFGTIDKKSGGLSIHPFDLDHEDDDVLDDLAQMVLSQGGEVIIASRDQIPKSRPILAILDNEVTSLEKTEKLQAYNEPNLKQRSI